MKWPWEFFAYIFTVGPLLAWLMSMAVDPQEQECADLCEVHKGGPVLVNDYGCTCKIDGKIVTFPEAS